MSVGFVVFFEAKNIFDRKISTSRPQNILLNTVVFHSSMRNFVIDIQQLITLLRNDFFQRNLVIVFAIYCELSVRNFT